jgi:predicted DNA-binding transcriptional regulator AlpA
MEMLSYSHSTINRLVKTGKLSKIQLGANSVRIKANSITAFLSSATMGS